MAIPAKIQIPKNSAGTGTRLEAVLDSGTTIEIPIIQNDVISENVAGSLTAPGVSGTGVKLVPASPGFGWRDILGQVTPKATGAGSPTRRQYAGGNVYEFAFAANDVCDFGFHMPHDYVPGSDLYVHIHWSHNGTDIAGTAEFTFFHQYSKGHNQANFSTEKAVTISFATVNISTTPRYRHRIDETQLSTAGGSGTLLDSDAIEPDGYVIGQLKLTGLPTVTGGYLFVHMLDIHYQSTNLATPNKSPSFYVP